MFTKPELVGEDSYEEIFGKSVTDNYKEVDVEYGWKVILNGKWVQKKDAPHKRLYASRAAAQDRTEMELWFRFHQAFRERNKQAFDLAYKI